MDAGYSHSIVNCVFKHLLSIAFFGRHSPNAVNDTVTYTG